MTEYIIKAADWAIGYNGVSLFNGCEEIVRCRDCRWLDDMTEWDNTLAMLYGEPPIYCGRQDGDGGHMLFGVEPDGFCAWGERR